MRTCINRPDAANNTRRSGYTLLDLIVTLMILTSVGTVALPRVSTAIGTYRTQAAATRIAGDLNYAIREAQARATPVTVTFNVTQDTYTISGLTNPDHPASTWIVDLKSVGYQIDLTTASLGGDNVITFDHRGIPDSGGTLSLLAGTKTLAMTISAATGEVTF